MREGLDLGGSEVHVVADDEVVRWLGGALDGDVRLQEEVEIDRMRDNRVDTSTGLAILPIWVAIRGKEPSVVALRDYDRSDIRLFDFRSFDVELLHVGADFAYSLVICSVFAFNFASIELVSLWRGSFCSRFTALSCRIWRGCSCCCGLSGLLCIASNSALTWDQAASIWVNSRRSTCSYWLSPTPSR